MLASTSACLGSGYETYTISTRDLPNIAADVTLDSFTSDRVRSDTASGLGS